jgi:hypothetical protein
MKLGVFWGFLLLLGCLVVSPAPVRAAESDGVFPAESFIRLSPTLPNERLDFNDDSQESCCAKDYTADGKPLRSRSVSRQPVKSGVSGGTATLPVPAPVTGMVKTAFEQANPRYQTVAVFVPPVRCSRFAELPESASYRQGPVDVAVGSLPIDSYSTNVSRRPGAVYATDIRKRNTSDFHVEVSGGESRVALRDVQGYSVCMGRGRNEAIAENTDHGSILAYNGDDRILLAGNNTNMLAWTGDGEDVIEISQARPSAPGASGWIAYQIYKTAVSGGNGTDRLVIRDTPFGTKWCAIGVYRLYGETFHVVEFALPPTITEGPRRQRINIGQSVEYVVIKGKTYSLQDFLTHGEPAHTVALGEVDE